jgi:hypothetical protein
MPVVGSFPHHANTPTVFALQHPLRHLRHSHTTQLLPAFLLTVECLLLLQPPLTHSGDDSGFEAELSSAALSEDATGETERRAQVGGPVRLQLLHFLL